MGHGVQFEGANKAFRPPQGVSEDQCATLHVFSNGACLISCWQLTAEELAEINRSRQVFLSVWSGDVLYPVLVGSESVVHGVVADYGAVWKMVTPPIPPTPATLDVIITELERQAEVSRAGGLGYLDADDPKEAVIDGRVDLVALAAAIDKAMVAGAGAAPA